MTILKVDTFQHDIVDEIKRKDDVYSKIPTTPTPETSQEKLKRPLLPIITVVLFIVTLIAIIGFSIYYFRNLYIASTSQLPKVTPEDVPKKTASLSSLSQTLEDNIGQYVQVVEKKQDGYIITLSPNSPAFSYMIKNEDRYIEELAKVIASGATSQPETKSVATTSQVINASSTTPLTTSSTTQATSTSTSTPKNQKTKVATTTPSKTKSSSSTSQTIVATPSEEDVSRTPLVFASTSTFWKDFTMSNQNMRIWSKEGRTVIYAFVTLNTLIIATSPDGVLTLRNAILAR
jgi:hypothetical protein